MGFGHTPDGTGLGQAYDAVYAFASALAVTATEPPSGANLAAGIASMSTAAPDDEAVHVGRLDALQLLSSFSAGSIPRAPGSFNELKWRSSAASEKAGADSKLKVDEISALCGMQEADSEDQQ